MPIHDDALSAFLGLLAAWKPGAVPVPVNPMNRAREVADVLHTHPALREAAADA